VETLLQEHNVEFLHGKPRTPREQGKVERFNGTFGEKLEKMMLERQTKRWIDLYKEFLQAYKETSLPDMRSKSPYELFFHRKPLNVSVPGMSSIGSDSTNGIPGIASDSTNGFLGIASNSTNGIPGIASDSTNGIPGIASDSTNGIPGIASNSMNGIPGIASNSTNGILGIASDSTNRIPGIASNSVNEIPGIASDSTHGIPGIASDSTHGISGMASNSDNTEVEDGVEDVNSTAVEQWDNFAENANIVANSLVIPIQQ